MFGDQLDFLILLSKLEGLNEERSYIVYRSAIFSAISILTGIANVLES